MLTYRLIRTVTAQILRTSGSATANRHTHWGSHRPVCCALRTPRLQPASVRGQRHRCLATAAPQATRSMDDRLTEYIQHIHDAPMQGVFHATGGGMQVCHKQAGLEKKSTCTQHSLTLHIAAGFDLVTDCPRCIKNCAGVQSTICTICHGGLVAASYGELCQRRSSTEASKSSLLSSSPAIAARYTNSWCWVHLCSDD